MADQIKPVIQINEGKVGIDVTTPFSKLQVGDPDVQSQTMLTIASMYTATPPALNFRTGHPNTSDIWNMAQIRGDDDGNFSGRLEFLTRGATSSGSTTEPIIRMVINDDGEVRFNNYSAGYLKTDGSGNITAESGIPGTGTFLPLAGGTMTGNINFNNSVRELRWDHTSGQSGSRAYGFIGEQGAYGRFALRSSNAADNILDTDVLVFNNDLSATFAGNVTIGSLSGGGTSVGKGLNIGNASPTIQLFDTTNNATLLMYTQDSNSVIGTYSNHALTFFTDSTQVLNLDTSQNATFAGAGTFETTLNVSATDGGGSPAMTAVINMAGYEGRGVGIKMKDNVTTSGGGDDNEWFVGTGYNQSGFNIGYAANGSQSSYSAQAKLQISTSGNATFAGSITTVGNILTQARVGIGTASPQSFTKVDIRSGTSAGNIGLVAYGYSGSGGRGLQGQGYAVDNTVAGTSTGVYGVATGGRTIAGSINIGGYFAATGSVNNYAIITGSGNVGINNSTPTFGLDVVGTARVTGNTQFVTQSTTDDSTKVATTAFVKNILAEQPAGLTFLGDWNAATNSPTLASGGGELANGSSTSLATDKLIDSAATFSSDGITANTDRIRLVQANGNIEFVVITAIDSDTQLTLASNAVTATGETYIVEASPFLSPEGGYYIVSTTGDEDLNGITDWTAGDWVLIATNNKFQKIDNTSILTGQGAEDKIAKWATSSGNPSVTLASSSITDTGSAVTIANPTTVTGSTTTTVLNVSGTGVQNGSTPGIKLSSSNTQQTVFAIGNTGTRQYELAVGGTASSIPGSFYAYDNNTSSFRLILSTAGNFSIGGTLPTQKLQLGDHGSLIDSIRIGTYAVAKNTRQYIGYTRDDSGLFESSGNGDTPSTVLPGVAGIRIVNTEGTLSSGQADNSVQLLTHIYNGGSRVALHANYDGNVGIGTVTPGSKLTVNETSTATAALNIVTARYGISLQGAGTSNTQYLLNLQSNGGSTNVMRVQSSGRVGIGATTPKTFLDVSGQGNRSGGNIIMGNQGDGSNKFSQICGTHYDADTEPEGISMIGTFSNETTNSVHIGGNIYESNPATDINFWTHTATTHAQGGTQRMIINSAGAIRFNAYGAGTLVTDASGNITAATSGAGTGSVTSVNVVTDGDALNVASNTITGSGTMTLPWQGGSDQYVNGLGNAIDFPSIPQGTVKISGTPVAKEFAEWTSADTIKGSATLQVNTNGTGVNVFGNNTSGATGIFRLCKNDSISDPRFQFIIGSSLENYIYSGNGSNSHALKFGLLDANDNAIENILTLKRGSGVQLPVLNEIGSDTDKFLMVSGTDNLIEYVTGANLLSYIGGAGSSGVTSIATTAPILGGTITGTGTLSLKTPVSGNWFNGGALVIGSDGLTEMGKYIDFHSSNTGTSDFDVRLTATSGLLTLTGSFKTTSNLTINGLASFATTNTDAKVNIAQGTGSVGVNVLHASENSFRLSTKVGTNSSSQTTPIFQQSLYYGLTENAGINYYRGGSVTGGRLAFSTNNGTERMFISSSGKIGLNEDSPTALLHVKALAATGTVFKLIGDPATTANQMLIYTTKAFNSSDTWYNMVCEAGNGSGGQTSTCIIERDGDLRNKNNSYGQISDSRLKENIQDATPKLDDIMKVKVKNFNFIGEDLKQIGVVAQELEEVFPGLVKEDKQPDLNGEEGGIYKSVKYSVLVPILLKAMQEQQEMIEDLKTRITKLEN